MEQQTFDPVLDLDHRQRGLLAALVSHEGYNVLHEVARTEVDKFILKLINTDTVDDKAVLDCHRSAKLASQLFVGFVNRINSEIAMYKASVTNHAPIDDTEGKLDIGALASTQDDIDRDQFLEEGAF